MDNYTDNDARLLIQEFTDKHRRPLGEIPQIIWERHLVLAALEQGHENGYKQREEGL